mgnify:CR=1 FL=1
MYKRQGENRGRLDRFSAFLPRRGVRVGRHEHQWQERLGFCLLYTSDAADERSSVDLGGRRILKKKKRESRAECNTDYKQQIAKRDETTDYDQTDIKIIQLTT